MLKVTIALEGKNDSDIENALNEVKRLLSEGNRSGFNENDSGKFEFFTEGQEEPDEEEADEEERTFVCSKCGQDFVLNEDGTTNHLKEGSQGIDDIDYDQDLDHVPYG